MSDTVSIGITIGIAIVGVANVWLLFIASAHRAEMRELRAVDASQGERLAALQLLVAGNYVTRDEFNTAMAAQSSRLLDAIAGVSRQISGKS